MMRTNRYPAVFAALAALALSIVGSVVEPASAKSAHPPLTLALLVERPGDQTLDTVLDLVGQTLGATATVHLVERQRIALAWRELELSALHPTDRRSVLALGRLVRADALALFTLSPDGTVLEVRLMDTRYGIRLLHVVREARPAGGIELLGADLAEQIGAALVKLTVAPNEQLVIGILDIRNAEPGTQLDWPASVLQGLLATRLGKDRRILVAEREAMLSILAERDLAAGPADAFKSSTILVEGELHHQKNIAAGEIQLVLSWRVVGGNATQRVEVAGNTAELEPIARQAAQKMVRAIGGSPLSDAWDPKAEATQYAKEAQVLLLHNRVADALPLLAAAHALSPQDCGIADAWLEAESPSDTPDLILAVQDLEARIAFLARAVAGAMPIKIQRHVWNLRGRTAYMRWQRTYREAGLAERIRDIHRTCNDLGRSYWGGSPPASHKDREEALTWALSWEVDDSENAEEALRRIAQYLEPWFRSDPEWVCGRLAQWGYRPPLASRWDDAHTLLAWIEYLDTLARTNSPQLRKHVELMLNGWDESTCRQWNGPFHPQKYYDHRYDHREQALNIQIAELWGSGTGTSYAILKEFFPRPPTVKVVPGPKPVPNQMPELKISMIGDLAAYGAVLPGEEAMRAPRVQAVQRGHCLWVASWAWLPGGYRVMLMGIDLETRSICACWTYTYPADAGAVSAGQLVPGEDATYVSSIRGGIVQFPGIAARGTGAVSRVDALGVEQGLPSLNVSALARVDNMLYVGIGGESTREGAASGLGKYDLKTRQWHTIASSLAKDRSCPLNREEPYTLRSLQVSPDRKKLFFVCDHELYKGTHHEAGVGQLTGLWEMEIATEKMRQLWRPEFMSGGPFVTIEPRDGPWVLRGFGYSGLYLTFDPATLSAEVASGGRVSSHLKLTTLSPGVPSVGTSRMMRPSTAPQYGYVAYSLSASGRNAWWGTLIMRRLCCLPWAVGEVEPLVGPEDILGEGQGDNTRITGIFYTTYGIVVTGAHKIALIQEPVFSTEQGK